LVFVIKFQFLTIKKRGTFLFTLKAFYCRFSNKVKSTLAWTFTTLLFENLESYGMIQIKYVEVFKCKVKQKRFKIVRNKERS